MSKAEPDRLLKRGVWFLVVGVLTSWLLGFGLLFIFAAAVCGFIGLFRERMFQGALLLVAALGLGVICAHIAAVTGVFAFSLLRAHQSAAPSHVSTHSHHA